MVGYFWMVKVNLELAYKCVLLGLLEAGMKRQGEISRKDPDFKAAPTSYLASVS